MDVRRDITSIDPVPEVHVSSMAVYDLTPELDDTVGHVLVEVSRVLTRVWHEVVEIDQAKLAVSRDDDIVLGEIWCVPSV